MNLELAGVGKTYGDPPVPALEEIELKAAEGSFTAVVGASGSGKSTLLRIIGGLTEPSAGRVTMGGRTPQQLRCATRRWGGWLSARPCSRGGP